MTSAKTPTQARDKASQLAKLDTSVALAVAAAIGDPWFRAQALAHVARYAPEAEVVDLAVRAVDAALLHEQVYKRLGAAAWPIRALIERGFLEPARRALSRVLAQSEAVTPASSRSEAVLLLFQAAFALGPQVREELLRQLAALFTADPFWRQLRNLADALAMLRTEDPDLVARTVAALPPGPQSAKLVRRLASAEAGAPRPFFW